MGSKRRTQQTMDMCLVTIGCKLPGIRDDAPRLVSTVALGACTTTADILMYLFVIFHRGAFFFHV